MRKLYLGDHIKIDAVRDALRTAKRKGDLPNISELGIEHFLESFNEVVEKSPEVGSHVTKSEMEKLFRRLKNDKGDKITDSELETIGTILLNDDYEF